MNVPFEVNKDRLIAEINEKKNLENGSQSIETGDVHFAIERIFLRIECFVTNNLSSLITLLVFCVGLRNSKVQKHYLYRNKNPFTSLTTEMVNKSMPGH